MKAEKTVRKISREYKQYARNVAEMKNRYDLQLAQERGHKEGRAEGLEQGREKEKLETARKMKEMGDPLEKIQLITGLSTETIEKM